MSCARCARLRSWLAKCSRCRARFQARKERKEMPVSCLNRCRKREAESPASAAQRAVVTGSPENFPIVTIRRTTPGVERAARQGFAETHLVERGAVDVVAAGAREQGLVGHADAVGEDIALDALQP